MGNDSWTNTNNKARTKVFVNIFLIKMLGFKVVFKFLITKMSKIHRLYHSTKYFLSITKPHFLPPEIRPFVTRRGDILVCIHFNMNLNLQHQVKNNREMFQFMSLWYSFWYPKAQTGCKTKFSKWLKTELKIVIG